MNLAGSVSIAAAGTGRLFFGPLTQGRSVSGIWFWGVSLTAAVASSLQIGVRMFTERPPDTLADFANGEAVLGNNPTLGNVIVVPDRTLIFLPLDGVIDRMAWIGMEGLDTAGDDWVLNAGLETGVGIAPFPNSPQSLKL